MGGLPVSVTDVWQATGQRPEAGVTWDPVRNINAASLVGSMSSGRKNQRYSSRVRACGLRFDRMYFKSAPDEPTHPVDFELKGLEKVPRAVCFPSDHWAIVGHFSLV
ncbi:unnamed protein product [Protopolystoma xenopodis]|uniref:Endonuclease/exonuclease/phosphatase domain-containing protein n=1 Tax=Protopolystoma xenopodis TaxID=117903 RepID=A0A448X1M2_9PLAT|nr:unnamed protein product [Protopolystoma xenopodis]